MARKHSLLALASESLKNVDDKSNSKEEGDEQVTHRIRPNDTNSQQILSQGRSQIDGLKAEVSKFRDLVNEGKLIQDVDITLIDRPPILMRSAHYWKTERFQEIKRSIYIGGQHDPITVRPSPVQHGRYILVKGDSRLTAFTQIHEQTGDPKWRKISARIEPLSEKEAIMKMVSENLDREAVAAYDQAVFYKNVLTDVFSGNREEAMQHLGITKGTLSTSLKVAEVPAEIMDAFPALYSAGRNPLFELHKALTDHSSRVPQLLAAADELQRAAATEQVRKIAHFLSDSQKAPSEPRKLTAPDGKVIGEFKSGRRSSKLTINEQEMPGFSDHLTSRLGDIYKEWLSQQ